MFMTRLLTVAIALPIFIGALLFLSPQLWGLFLLPVLAAASWEWGGLAAYRSTARVAYAILLVLSGAILFYLLNGTTLPVRLDIAVYALSCAFWVAVAPFWLSSRWATRNAFVLGIAGWIALVPMWLALARLQSAPWALLLFMSVVWVADTAAYMVGKRWGRTKLAPRVSPGKTWEGALGAAAAVTIYYALLLLIVPAGSRVIEGWWGFIIFAGIFALSVEGDLFESWIKRTAGVKDSGQLLPGHGGILDRIDGLTATMPAAALAFYLR
jgi:phosphatidate cytidylyltransferase